MPSIQLKITGYTKKHYQDKKMEYRNRPAGDLDMRIIRHSL